MSKKKLISEIVHYSAVLGLIWIFNMALFVFLVEVLDVNYILAAVLSFTAGVFINYYFNAQYTFKERRFKDKNVEAAVYVSSSILVLGASLLLFWIMTEMFNVYYIYSRIISGGIGFISLFWIRKKLLFTKKN